MTCTVIGEVGTTVEMFVSPVLPDPTLDRFAMAALSGLIAEYDPAMMDETQESTLRALTRDYPGSTPMEKRYAVAAYRLADAMMAERARDRTVKENVDEI